jgi:hypothetical protein
MQPVFVNGQQIKAQCLYRAMRADEGADAVGINVAVTSISTVWGRSARTGRKAGGIPMPSSRQASISPSRAS